MAKDFIEALEGTTTAPSEATHTNPPTTAPAPVYGPCKTCTGFARGECGKAGYQKIPSDVLATGCPEYEKPARFSCIGRNLSYNDSTPLKALQRAKNVRWLIDGVLPQDSTALAFGPPGTFKSFVAIDMAVAIASGQEWQGRQTEKAAVIYLAAEGGDNVQHRYAGAVLARGLEYSADLPMEVVQLRPRLDEPEGLEILKALFDGAIDRNSEKYDPSTIDRVTEEEDEEIKKDVRRECLEQIKRSVKTNEEYRGSGLTLQEIVENELENEWLERSTKLNQSRITRLEKDKEDAFNSTHYLVDTKQCRTMLLIVDTFAKCASDDTKAVVARYNRTLLDLQAYAKEAGFSLTFLTIDHTTKAGDTFMGSMAKEGDNDTMIEIERTGDAYSTKVICRKQKDAADFEPLHLDMVKIAIDGFTDGYGRTLETLRVVDGTKSSKLRKIAGTNGETVKSKVLGLIEAASPITLSDLKAQFAAMPANQDKKANTVHKAFERAIDGLSDDGLIDVSDDTNMVTLTA